MKIIKKFTKGVGKVVKLIGGPFSTIDRVAAERIPFEYLYGKMLAIAIGLLLAMAVALVLRLVSFVVEYQLLEHLSDYIFIIAGTSLLTAVVLYAIIWPLDKRGTVESLIIKSGIRQRNQMSTELVALSVGFVCALAFVSSIGYVLSIMLGTGAWYLAFDWRVIVVAMLISWTIATAVVLYAFKKINDLYVRSDLTIVNVVEHADGPRELVVRNDCDEPISLWKAKFEDSHGNYYNLDVTETLRPGETGTFELPKDFDLKTVEYEVPFILKVFYDNQKSPSIYVRTGDTFVLEWDESRDVGEPEAVSQNTSD